MSSSSGGRRDQRVRLLRADGDGSGDEREHGDLRDTSSSEPPVDAPDDDADREREDGDERERVVRMRRRVARERETERDVACDEAPQDRPWHPSSRQDEAEHADRERRDREELLRLRGSQEERDHLPPSRPELRSQDEVRGQTIRRRIRIDEVRRVASDGQVGQRKARREADEEREAPGARLGSQPLLRDGEADEHRRHDEECDAGLDRGRDSRRTRGDEESAT